MKKLLNILAVFMLFQSINASANNTNVCEKYELLSQSCFSYYHYLFDEYYGGVNLNNVGDFNALVAQCEYAFGG